MANPRLEALRSEFDKLRAGIDTINTRAATESRDLSDPEQADSDALYARCEAIKPQIETEAAKERSLQSSADVLARITPRPTPATGAAPATKPVMPWGTPGEFVRSFLGAHPQTAHRTGLDSREQSEIFERVVAQQLLADNTGLVPFSILGDLINFIDASRPAVSSMNSKPMPAKGSTFGRPRVTQHVSVGLQATQLSQLSSQKMTITYDTVTKGTYGGVVDLSQQDLDWTEPAVLDIVLQDLADQYAIQTETAGTAALVAAATNVSRLQNTGAVATTIAVASNGAALPQATINIASNAGFATAGSALVVTSAGVQVVKYTGTTGTTLTGCTGGTGTMSTGGAVTAALQTATSPATVLQGIYNAAVNVYNAAKQLPDTLWISTDVWAWLGGLSDTAGRPATNQKNGTGVNTIGALAGPLAFTGDLANISFVVAPTLAVNSMILGARKYAEVYEQRNGLLRIGQPSVLGQEVAMSGYFATYMRPEAFAAIAL